VEIDEFQNYDKALGALGEAYKTLSHAKLPDSQSDMKLNDIKNRMMLVKKFTEAKASVPHQLTLLLIGASLAKTLRRHTVGGTQGMQA